MATKPAPSRSASGKLKPAAPAPAKRPAAMGDDYVSPKAAAQMRQQRDEARENAAGKKIMGFKKGGMVKGKAKPKGYMCGGKVKK
jgi:hypothetical protein